MSSRSPVDELHRALSAYIATHHQRMPRHVELRFVFGENHREELVVPDSELRVAQMVGDAERPVEDAILEVVGALDAGQILSGEEIAQRAGYAFGGWFKGKLAKMGRDGDILATRRGYGQIVEA